MVIQPRDIYSPVFAIARAAELADMHPQTLRQYDRIGLVSPQRTRGNTRRYSLYDIEQLRDVARLSNEGLTLEGIRRVLQLENQVRAMKNRIEELERALGEQMIRQDPRVFTAGTRGEIVSVKSSRTVRRSGEVVVWRPKKG